MQNYQKIFIGKPLNDQGEHNHQILSGNLKHRKSIQNTAFEINHEGLFNIYIYIFTVEPLFRTKENEHQP